MKVIGKRTLSHQPGLEQGDIMQATANALCHHPVKRRTGVVRFKTFEEADRWWVEGWVKENTELRP